MTTSTSSNLAEQEIYFPVLTRWAVDKCTFSSWYPKFKKHSPKATVIKPLTKEFIEYLECDRVFIPDGSDKSNNVIERERAGLETGPINRQFDYKDNYNEMSEFGNEDNNGSDDEDDPHYEFPQLDQQIRQAVKEYEAVFPKLNWSSPRDSSWIAGGPSLQCHTPAEIYLLLKSSDFIVHDLKHAFDDCVDTDNVTSTASNGNDTNESLQDKKTRPDHYELVLKRWFDVHPSHEFRCFVRNNKLLGISQRDSNLYDFLQTKQAQEDIIETIQKIFKETISPSFELEDFIFDVYLSQDRKKAYLMDFNVYAPRTDCLLFTWNELYSLSKNTEGHVELRVVDSHLGQQAMPAFSANRYPSDVVQLSDGKSIAEFAEQWKAALEDAIIPE